MKAEELKEMIKHLEQALERRDEAIAYCVSEKTKLANYINCITSNDYEYILVRAKVNLGNLIIYPDREL